jgi:hypothetical protein
MSAYWRLTPTSGYQVPFETADKVAKLTAASSTRGWFDFLVLLRSYACFLWYGVPLYITVRPAIMEPRMISFFTKLKENEASELPVGVAGFCWGGM